MLNDFRCVSQPTIASPATAGDGATNEPIPVSFERNLLNRSLDRLLATMGKLDDAAPLFAPTENLPGAGVLLVIPALVHSEVLTIDAVVDYEAEQDDPNRSIPNPTRKAVDKELRKARGHLAKLQERYGSEALDYLEGRTPTIRAFTKAEREIQRELFEASAKIARLIERQKSLPTRILISQSPEAEKAMKPWVERKHLSDI